ncbi:integrase catalytic domain-containing protein [Trichonephila clavipes]|nr:integrase catalytic domain-containing protein [Trichonephila clavipes]
MYRQILVDPNQRDLQRIMWKTSADAPVKTYKLSTVTYGTVSAPFLATRTLSCTRAFDDGPRNFEPWSSDSGLTPELAPLSPNYHTTPTGKRFNSQQI